MLNKYLALGRLTKDVELKETQKGKKIYAYFQLAIPDDFNREQVEFVDFRCWGNVANYLAKYGKKGSLVSVKDSKIKSYTVDNNKTTWVEVSQLEVIFGSNVDNNDNNNENENETQGGNNDDDPPF